MFGDDLGSVSLESPPAYQRFQTSLASTHAFIVQHQKRSVTNLSGAVTVPMDNVSIRENPNADTDINFDHDEVFVSLSRAEAMFTQHDQIAIIADTNR